MGILKNKFFTKSIQEYSTISNNQAKKQRFWPYESILYNKNLKLVKFSVTERNNLEDFLVELRDVKMNLCKLLQNQWSILRDFDRRRGCFSYFLPYNNLKTPMNIFF